MIVNSKGQEINGTAIYLVVKLLYLQTANRLLYRLQLLTLQSMRVEQGSSEYQIVNFPPSNLNHT